MSQVFPYHKNKVHVKTCEKILTNWEKILENSSFAGLSACQLWGLCTRPRMCDSVCDRLSFFLELQDVAFHLNASVDKIAKYTYSAHRCNRIAYALMTLYIRHFPIPQGRLFLQSGILTLPELQRRSDRFRLIYECPDAIYLDAGEAFSFELLSTLRSEASSAYGSTDAASL